MKPLYCRSCQVELDYIGISKDKMHTFDCPQCGEREFYKDLNVEFPDDKEYTKHVEMYPLGSNMSRYILKKIINRA